MKKLVNIIIDIGQSKEEKTNIFMNKDDKGRHTFHFISCLGRNKLEDNKQANKIIYSTWDKNETVFYDIYNKKLSGLLYD